MTTDLGLVSSPSPGSSSTSTSNSTRSTSLRKVLLLIECQVCRLAPPPEGVPNSALVGRNIERALRFARASPCPPLVVHVRNSGDVGDADQPGAPGWQLALAPAPGEPVIDKTKNNAFAGTRLGELVDKKAAIIVVGMQSDFCIRATCSAALGRGNTVFLVEDAHSTYDRPEAYAGGGPVLVTPARTVVREIESELEEAGAQASAALGRAIQEIRAALNGQAQEV